jgi:hypothetical protein
MYEQELGNTVPTQTMKALNKLVLAHSELDFFGSDGFDLHQENLVAEWIIKYKRDTNARERRYVLTPQTCPCLFWCILVSMKKMHLGWLMAMQTI